MACRKLLRCYSIIFPSRHMFLKLALPHLHFYIDTHCVYYFWRLMWQQMNRTEKRLVSISLQCGIRIKCSFNTREEIVLRDYLTQNTSYKVQKLTIPINKSEHFPQFTALKILNAFNTKRSMSGPPSHSPPRKIQILCIFFQN